MAPDAEPREAPVAAVAAPPVPAQASPQPLNPLKHLVIDTAAIIKGAGMTLAGHAERFWTVPEVLQEVRDKKARHHLDTLPFELQLREPSDEALRHTIIFARQTGDLGALSRTDLKVIALTYMLEREETGGAHLRAAPVRPVIALRKPKPLAAAAAATAASCDSEASAAAPGQAAAGMAEAADLAAEGLSPMLAGLESVGAADGAAEAAEADACGDGDGGDGASAEEGGSGDGSDDSDDDDDDWEPNAGAGRGGAESGGAEEEGKGDKAELTVAFAGERSASAATARAEPFSLQDDDFPSLGGPTGGAAATAAAEGDAPLPAPPSATATSWAAAALKAPARPPPLLAPTAPVAVYATRSISSGSADVTAAPAAAAASSELVTTSKESAARTFVAAAPSRLLGASASHGMSSGLGADEEDDGAGWITPANLDEQRLSGLSMGGGGGGGKGKRQNRGKGGGNGSGGGHGAEGKCRAGCVTADFAMQNVLLQMGLPLVALDGMVVRRVRQWVLRCAACFRTTADSEKRFCPVCGNATLDRVACSVDAATGELKLHLRPGYRPNLRGTKYSLPRPAIAGGGGGGGSKGRFEGELLLREDQLMTGIWRQRANRSGRDLKSAFGDEIAADVGVRVTRGADVVVGLGKGNPNARRGRERRGKKKERSSGRDKAGWRR